MKRICSLLLLICIVFFAVHTAVAHEETVFVNPEGGKFYHRLSQCPTIRKEYHAVMVEVPISKLKEEPYNQLLPCPCNREDFLTWRPPGIQEPLLYVKYQSPYDTAIEGKHYVGGRSYTVGNELPVGIYTIQCMKNVQGRLVIRNEDGVVNYECPLKEKTMLTFYLREGMLIDLPLYAEMGKVEYGPEFQKPFEKSTMNHRRCVTGFELPMAEYYIKTQPGKEGRCIVSSIYAELGEETSRRIDIPSGQIVRLDLMNQRDVFVEFIDCVVWRGDSEG